VSNKPVLRDDGRAARVSRRTFLKHTGTIIFVAGSGSFALAEGTTRIAGHAAGSGPVPVSDGYLLVDVEKCQGCASCMLACSLVHEGVQSQALSRIQIMQDSFGKYPHDIDISHCRQCVDPACVTVCPEGALTADAEIGNVRRVDRSKCVGCGACMEACPFTPSRSILVADEGYGGEDKAKKCDLCADAPHHWDAAGGGPSGKQACVAVCPVEAIRFTKKIPVQEGDDGYKVDLKDLTWRRLGYP